MLELYLLNNSSEFYLRTLSTYEVRTCTNVLASWLVDNNKVKVKSSDRLLYVRDYLLVHQSIVRIIQY